MRCSSFLHAATGHGRAFLSSKPLPVGAPGSFVWHSCAACSLDDPVRQGCGPDPIDDCRFLGGHSGISTGTILLITFLVLFSFYFIIGLLYNRFIMGKTGMEQVLLPTLHSQGRSRQSSRGGGGLPPPPATMPGAAVPRSPIWSSGRPASEPPRYVSCCSCPCNMNRRALIPCPSAPGNGRTRVRGCAFLRTVASICSAVARR